MTLIGIFANHGRPVNGLLPGANGKPGQPGRDVPGNLRETMFRMVAGSEMQQSIKVVEPQRSLRPGKRCRASQRPGREEVPGVSPSSRARRSCAPLVLSLRPGSAALRPGLANRRARSAPAGRKGLSLAVAVGIERFGEEQPPGTVLSQDRADVLEGIHD